MQSGGLGRSLTSKANHFPPKDPIAQQKSAYPDDITLKHTRGRKNNNVTEAYNHIVQFLIGMFVRYLHTHIILHESLTSDNSIRSSGSDNMAKLFLKSTMVVLNETKLIIF